MEMRTGAPRASATRRWPPSVSLSKALETTERARGHLFSFHQLTGTADLELDRAVELLRAAGHHEWAERVEREILGRNVIPGHWTFQIVEAYDGRTTRRSRSWNARRWTGSRRAATTCSRRR